jgi:amidophosphoribosyltransferase
MSQNNNFAVASRLTPHPYHGYPRQVPTNVPFSAFTATRKRQTSPILGCTPCSIVDGSLRHRLARWRAFHVIRERLVADIYNTHALEQLTGSVAIGHNRYSGRGTTSERTAALSQLCVWESGARPCGSLINAQVLRHELEAYGAIFQSTSNSENHPSDRPFAGRYVAGPSHRALSQVRGAFSIVCRRTAGSSRYAIPHGPGRFVSVGWVTYLVASKPRVRPAPELTSSARSGGELVVLNEKGVTSHKPFAPVSPAMCVFE